MNVNDMTINDDDATVWVKFEVNSRDFFRANMDLFRWRFVLGLVVVLGLMIPLVYLFIVIGEQEILLKTSPLFIGMPLIVLGGPILRMHAAARKYVAALPPSQRQVEYMFRSVGDGFDSVSGASSGHTAWKDVMQVVEKQTYFLIAINAYERGILPKRGFQPADIAAFRRILQSRLGDRAKLITH